MHENKYPAEPEKDMQVEEFSSSTYGANALKSGSGASTDL